jgi:hypothetical protein
VTKAELEQIMSKCVDMYPVVTSRHGGQERYFNPDTNEGIDILKDAQGNLERYFTWSGCPPNFPPKEQWPKITEVK